MMGISSVTKKRKLPPPSNLDEYEKDIETHFDRVKPYTKRKVSAETKAAKKASAQFMRKDARITIRVTSSDLERIKRLALQEGLPYQTFITSVLHKLSTGTLVDPHSHT